MAVARVLPGVGRDLPRLADAARRQDHPLRLEENDTAGFAPVPDGPAHALAVLEQTRDRALHVDVDAVILERANHLEAGTIADVRQSRVAVAAEVSLQDAAVLGAVEQRAPALELE